MKKQGILNAQLAGCLAALGHKDTILIADAGLPIPAGVALVDLVLVGGVPTFRQVFEAIVQEVVIEGYTVASEMEEANAALCRDIRAKLSGCEEAVLPHDRLKETSADVKFAVRTGEVTPYANVILRCGVAFP